MTQQSELEEHSERDQGGSGQDGTHGAFMGERVEAGTSRNRVRDSEVEVRTLGDSHQEVA